MKIEQGRTRAFVSDARPLGPGGEIYNLTCYAAPESRRAQDRRWAQNYVGLERTGRS